MEEVEVKSVFDTTNEYYKDGKYPLFCGHPVALIDMVNSPYPELFYLYEKQMAQNWKWDEVNLSQDRMDMLNANPEYVELMTDTIMYQWTLDSIAANAILPMFAPFISSPEVNMLFTEITRMECLTGDHEVLTTEGWKYIPEVTTEDKVAQWDYDTKEVTFVNPTHTVKKGFKGKLVHITSSGGNIDQLVTPNHRIPVVFPYDYKGASKDLLAGDAVFHGHNAIPVSGYAPSGRGMTDFERILVAVQADGSLAGPRYTGAKGHLHYSFGLSKERKIKRLKDLCDRLGYEVREDGKNRSGTRNFRVLVPTEDYSWDAKNLDWVNIEEISKEWAEDFIEELSHWDGNVTARGLKRYISTNKSCIEKAEMIGRLAGRRTNLYTIPPREGVLFPSGNLSDTKEAYQLSFNKAEHLIGNNIIKDEVEFEGDVYCLSVPSTYFMVRRNGSVSITGNCIHAASYSHIVQQTMQSPKEALEKTMNLQESLTRGGKIIEVFDHLAIVGGKIRAGLLERDSDEAREALFLGMVNLYILERMSFMSSFAVTFAISELGVFQGIGSLVSLIARDEQLHADADKIICKHLIKQMPEVYKKVRPHIEQMIDEAVQIEIDWNKYLFDGRSCVGLNKTLLDDWVKYMAQDIYDVFGFDKGSRIEENPLPYMDFYLDLGSTQKAPQESDIVDYLIGGVESTLGDEELDF